jgi:light-regulated signal transduction histidine kinase (bacteriophytochrome)
LRQLFQNLISDAIRFRAEEPPQIRISVEQKDQEWLFAVQDNGIGFEQEYGERIFVIFKRLHVKEKYPGTGIGLTLCRKIVECHGGQMWAESEVGQGATFYFTIPVSGGTQA